MPLPSADQELRERFRLAYQRNQSPVLRRIERRVCGCDYGSTSWANRQEIGSIADKLDLGPARRLLDIGSGSGWPGLYFAQLSGCDVALVDLPPEGLAIAAGRAKADGLSAACYISVASAAALPYADGSFDAINHSDVLCCLPEKRTVLEECRRVIRQDGRMIFTVLYLAPDQSGTDLPYVIENAPPYVTSDVDYQELLRQTGWIITERTDLSGEFLANARKFNDADHANEAELEELLGAADIKQRLEKDENLIDIISNGHMRRDLYALRPG